MKRTCLSIPALALSMTAAPAVLAQPAQVFELTPTVVTAPGIEAPLTVVTDPKAPRQPIPAHDGADFLKSIPGFSIVRKGGTDGDPVLRGFSGSRLGILLDGQEIYGGCGGRMDPPTAYVYPEMYDRVTIRKGPQSVLYGPGHSAGVVLFERDIDRFTEFGWKGHGSLTFGSHGRNDQMADVRVGNPDFYVQVGATRADSNNYSDGDGREIHSKYTRWSTNAAVGWTPDDNTRLELSAVISDGEAAYSDRMMDGVEFKRENVSLMFEKYRISPLVEKLEARIYRNNIDHVMDNYSLRNNKMPMYRVSNPERTTVGGRVATALRLTEPLGLTIGLDTMKDTHRSRMLGAPTQAVADTYKSLPYGENMKFRKLGLFSEGVYDLNDQQRIIGGMRIDWHNIEDRRATSATVGQKDKRTLKSGFLRFESDIADSQGTVYAGLGHAQRMPDFWELMRLGANGEPSAFHRLNPEKTTQFDTGITWEQGDLHVGVSAFYGHVDDYVLINWAQGGRARNVDARVMGGEIDLAYRFMPHWQAQASLAYVYGKNRTDHLALAQQPPLELRLGLNYESQQFSAGALWRLVAAQHRYDVGSGGISQGRDIGPSSGFGVLSLNAGWRPNKLIQLTAGIDNVLDKTYSEHLSRTGFDVPDMQAFPLNTRINEPGRTFWLKAQVAF